MDNNNINLIFEYAKNNEKIFEIHNKYYENEKILMDNKDIGTCFCSILNDKNKVIALKQNFDKTYINKYSNKIELLRIKEIIDLTYNNLIHINKYFIILSNKFNKLSKESQMTNIFNDFNELNKQRKNLPSLTKELLIKMKLKHYNNYMKETVGLLDNIINIITSFESYSISRLSFKDIKIPYCYMTSILDENKSYKYTYTIYTLDDLLAVSFYILSNNKYYLKQCIYPNCNKFFVTKRKQTRYCENPCPSDYSKTCRSIRKKVNHDLDMEYWEMELDALDKDVNSSREFFNYYIRKSNNQREIKMLQRNKNIFTSTLKDLKQFIKGCTNDNKKKEYIKIYKDFVKEVRSNQKLSQPIFKVKKPKF